MCKIHSEFWLLTENDEGKKNLNFDFNPRIQEKVKILT